jgi:hypothetical protein
MSFLTIGRNQTTLKSLAKSIANTATTIVSISRRTHPHSSRPLIPNRGRRFHPYDTATLALPLPENASTAMTWTLYELPMPY